MVDVLFLPQLLPWTPGRVQLSQDEGNGVCPVAPWQGVGGRLHHLAQAAAWCHFCTWGWMAGFDPDAVNSVPVLSFKEKLRGGKTFPAAAAATGWICDIPRPDVLWFSLCCPPSLFNKCIKLKLVSDIETHTVWKLTYRESFPSAYWVCRGSAEIMASTETDEKCHPSSAVLLIWLSHIPTRSFFCSVSHFKLAARVPTTRFFFFNWFIKFCSERFIKWKPCFYET